MGEFSPCTGSVDDDACFALLGRQAGRQAGSRYSGGVELSSDWLVGALWEARKCPAQREVQSHRPSLFGRRLLLLELWAGPRSRPKPRDQGEESPQGLHWAVPLLWVAHSAPTARRVQFLQQASCPREGPPAIWPLWLGGKAGGMLLSVLPSLGTLSMSCGLGDDHESHSYSRWKETTVTATHFSHSFTHSINKLPLSSRPEC